ncbi:MAG: hypothetical protein KJ674_02750 [Nanoarchaeota archaeon]|nr:hypothetical protein [Nanoarchaeota archaeon]
MHNINLIEASIVDYLLELSLEVMRRFRGTHKITQKSDNSLVTDSDRNIETLLKNQFANLLPNSYFLGEENSDMTPDQYRKIFENEYVWAIDPIDDTANFANGNPFFAVSVGLLKKDNDGHTPVAGAVLFPALNEIIYTKDGKSYSIQLSSREETELQTPRNESEKSTVMLTDSFYKKYDFNHQVTNAQPRQVGCTVANIAYTAIGRSIGTMTAAHLWDFAGGLAIAHNLGVNMRRYSDGAVKDFFGVDDFIIGNPKKMENERNVYS